MKKIFASFATLALLLVLCGVSQAATYYSDTFTGDGSYEFVQVDFDHEYDGSVSSPYKATLTITAFDVDNGEVDQVFLKTGSGDVYLGDLTQLPTWDSYYPGTYNYVTTTVFDVTPYLAADMDFYIMVYDGANSHAMKLVTSVLEVTATPIPGAAWLLGSGLLGLVGLRRKIKS